MATGNDDHDAFDEDSYVPEGTQFFGRGWRAKRARVHSSAYC